MSSLHTSNILGMTIMFPVLLNIIKGNPCTYLDLILIAGSFLLLFT